MCAKKPKAIGTRFRTAWPGWARPACPGYTSGKKKFAVLGCDGVSDVVPSGYDTLIMPIHSCTLVAMGIHLLDNCMLDDLSAACASRSRWTFMLTVAPLVLMKGTASPVNPIAMF